MAAFASNEVDAPITGINVTPLVDITLVLLIIFMVTAKLVTSQAMAMDLPKAATGAEIQAIFSVSLSSDGKRSIDGVSCGENAEFLERARNSLKEHPELRAVVQADGTVDHSRVMQSLDILRQAGITRVAFGVAQAPPVSLKVEH